MSSTRGAGRPRQGKSTWDTPGSSAATTSRRRTSGTAPRVTHTIAGVVERAGPCLAITDIRKPGRENPRTANPEVGEVSGVQIHDATTGHLVHRLAEAGAVTRVAIAPDATWLATADGGGVSVWDAATARRIHRVTHGSAQAPPIIAAIGTTTDGGRLAIADADALTVWDPHTSHSTAHDLPGRDQTGTPRQIHELPSDRLAVVGEHGIHIINS